MAWHLIPHYRPQPWLVLASERVRPGHAQWSNEQEILLGHPSDLERLVRYSEAIWAEGRKPKLDKRGRLC